MFSSLHRMLPFLGGRGRGANGGGGSGGGQEDADGSRSGKRQKDSNESESSQAAAVAPCDNNVECDLVEANHQGEVAAETSSGRQGGSLRRPQRLISGAMTQMRLRSRDEYLVDDDISKGREHHKVPAVSYKPHDKPPLDFHYVVDQIQYRPIGELNSSLAQVASCECQEDCSDGTCHCSSNQKSGRAYDSKGRLHANYNLEAPPIIYECNAACKCNRKRCKNMVIQNGCKHRLVLFRTKSRGWGIRTLEHLKRGTFVGLYSGELVSASESATRQDDTYLFNLASTQIYHRSSDQPNQVEHVETMEADIIRHDDGQEEEEEGSSIVSIISDGPLSPQQEEAGADEEGPNDEQTKPEPPPAASSQVDETKVEEVEQYVCDAKFYGNFTRFVNHSCNPNVIGIRSFTVHQDPKFPHIAFFTNQDIPAGQELTLNYGDNYWLVKCKRDSCYCLCQQPNCRFNRKTFPRTLKQHKQK